MEIESIQNDEAILLRGIEGRGSCCDCGRGWGRNLNDPQEGEVRLVVEVFLEEILSEVNKRLDGER